MSSSSPRFPNLGLLISQLFIGLKEPTTIIPVTGKNSFGKEILVLKKLSDVMKDQYLDWLRKLFGQEFGAQKSSPRAFFWFWAHSVRLTPLDGSIIDTIVGHLTRLLTPREPPKLPLEYPVLGVMARAQIEPYDPEGSDYFEPEVTPKEKRRLERESYPIVGNDDWTKFLPIVGNYSDDLDFDDGYSDDIDFDDGYSDYPDDDPDDYPDEYY